ncbi:MAG: hypothetical protein RBT49_03075 [Bacteroidales bacterium]|nr:hypothetical protein [Bacteroidales bacterium]
MIKNKELEINFYLSKDIIFTLIAFIAILFHTFPLIKGYIMLPQLTVMFLVSIFSIILYPYSFVNSSTVIYIISIITIVFLILFKDSFDLGWFLTFLTYWLFVVSISNIYLYTNNFEFFYKLALTVLFITIFTSIITLPHLFSNPFAVRDLIMSGNAGDSESVRTGQRLGMISYGLLHSIPTLFPVLIYFIKKSEAYIHKLYWGILLAILYYLTIKAGFATVIILSTFIIIPSFLISSNKKKNIFLFVIITLLLLPILNLDLVYNGLDFIKPYFANSIMYKKIDDIQTTLMIGKAGHVALRGSLYLNSWESFLSEPLFGSSKFNSAGGHAFLLDFLAWFGLIGTLPIVIFFSLHLKRIIQILKDDQKIYFFLALIPFIILSFTKATPFYEQILFVFIVIPGLLVKPIKKGVINKPNFT